MAIFFFKKYSSYLTVVPLQGNLEAGFLQEVPFQG